MMITFLTQWLIPMVHCIGLTIALWAFRKSSKKGYILIALFFALAVFGRVVMPRINRAMSTQEMQSLSDEKRDEMFREIDAVYQRYYEEEPVSPEPASLSLNIPFGELILIAGLWGLAGKEKTAAAG